MCWDEVGGALVSHGHAKPSDSSSTFKLATTDSEAVWQAAGFADPHAR